MPRIFKHFTKPPASDYVFPDAAELQTFEDEPEAPPAEPQAEEAPKSDAPRIDPQEPVSYARLQSEMILDDARRQAEELLEQARLQAETEAEAIRAAGREEGYQDGYAAGTAQALQEGVQAREQHAAALEQEIAQFFEQAGKEVDRRLDDSVEDLRDLALAVAEKVVGISLRSSSEVIARMIQAAIDKRKRREWVHIYISECDAKGMGQIPASLSAALAGLSDRVRIIPMADDEPGTCIVEMPDEIIDASAATQLGNIRAMLMDAPPGGGPLL